MAISMNSISEHSIFHSCKHKVVETQLTYLGKNPRHCKISCPIAWRSSHRDIDSVGSNRCNTDAGRVGFHKTRDVKAVYFTRNSSPTCDKPEAGWARHYIQMALRPRTKHLSDDDNDN